MAMTAAPAMVFSTLPRLIVERTAEPKGSAGGPATLGKVTPLRAGTSGNTATAFKRDLAVEPEAELATGYAEPAEVAPAPSAAPKSTKAEKAAIARMKGYEGESCTECGNFTMVRNGTCLKCDTCGNTSGCS